MANGLPRAPTRFRVLHIPVDAWDALFYLTAEELFIHLPSQISLLRVTEPLGERIPQAASRAQPSSLSASQRFANIGK